jgi:hypothetical protein
MFIGYFYGLFFLFVSDFCRIHQESSQDFMYRLSNFISSLSMAALSHGQPEFEMYILASQYLSVRPHVTTVEPLKEH